MRTDRRVRRLVTADATWYWSVRQRVEPDYADCRVTLSLFTDAPTKGTGRRVSFVFAPTPTGVISNCYFESGTVIRLPDRHWLNLYEPGTVRRLLDAAAPALERQPAEKALELDGWRYFEDASLRQ
ncbi:hypothetical protein BN159_0607 [Streptomyces davaonensis JCM 4913]|uniref:Uncharacterized protein n=1 Tax=Streptomyces davaonensis (strain DSM 101723 / JCM 4913 / KCC S-0913 / 768) TaxID=1214101 RepID=K4QSP0_STRDJ|nr:hypothetical protein [Streptomyces davaonensis]CCK24986.1 hypothetical protein BN159_0607 [Streptomyces davaonensis JCM 4913]